LEYVGEGVSFTVGSDVGDGVSFTVGSEVGAVVVAACDEVGEDVFFNAHLFPEYAQSGRLVHQYLREDTL